MIKIVQIFPKLNRGGLEIGALQVSCALKKAGVEPTIIAEPGPLLETLKSEKIHYFPLNISTKNPFKILINSFHIYKFIKSENVDLIHIRSRAPGWSAWIAAKLAKKPIISTVHGQYSGRSFLKKLYNSVMLRPQHIIAISDFSKKYILDHYSSFLKHSPHIHTIHRGIETKFFESPPQPSFRQELCHSLGIPPQDFLLFMVGRISAQKGIHIAIEALSYIKNKNLHLLLVGDTQEHSGYFDNIRNTLKSLQLDGHAHFLGPHKNVVNFYDAVDGVLFPITRPEPFGRVIVEAQARKKILIGSHIGASSELMPPSMQSFLFPCQNAKILAQKITMLMHLTKIDKNYIENEGYHFVKDRFREDIMTSQTIEVYKEILKRK